VIFESLYDAHLVCLDIIRFVHRLAYGLISLRRLLLLWMVQCELRTLRKCPGPMDSGKSAGKEPLQHISPGDESGKEKNIIFFWSSFYK